MTDIKKLETNLSELQDVIELAKIMKIMEEADKFSAKEICDNYIKENNLEYLQTEIEQAFRFGFFTYSRQKEKLEKNGHKENDMKNNIVVVTAKPYDLVLDDGKTITVQNEIYIGTINPESGAEYFYGAWFEKNEESFQFLGSISINQEDFEKRAGTVKDLEGKRIDLNEAF